jgi:ABC-type antimicrobial peptide transport system permease subunit
VVRFGAVFYLSYLRSELFRRKGRTILTLLGLAIGVALVITIAALSDGLDDAQARALNPLSSIGTDLTVTLQPQEADASSGAFGGPGGGAFPGGGFAGGREVLQANQSAITDLSKLGKPGTHFVHDFFLPGTQLTFPQSQAEQIAALPGVASVSTGLMLSGVHQEGTVPKIVTKIRTGGDRLTVTGRVRFQPTAAEQEKIRECFQKAIRQSGGAVPPASGGGANGANGNAPNTGGSRLGGNRGQAQGVITRGGGGGGGARRFFFSSGAAQKCLPVQFRNFSRTVVTPQQTIQQLVAPPQTNIKSTSYTIGGVDTTKPNIGVVTPALVSKGHFLSTAGGKEALLAASYASRQKLKVGSALDLNGTTFTVVGLVRPPLGGQSADVYVPVAELQKLSSQTGLANVVLVRAKDGDSVTAVQHEIQTKFPNAEVASQKQVTDQISGSLVDASNLSHRLGVALAILAALAAFLLAALLTLSSVGKRVREIGTLKALGWTQRLVLRQIVGESTAQGILGGLLGVALGAIVATAIGAFGPTLGATSSSGGGGGAFGFGQLTARTVTDHVDLTAPLSPTVLLLGFALAVVGGLIAGAAGAFRAARLRPADALRTLE